MRQDEGGVPPLAFVQLLNSNALQPDAVAHFRRLVRREGWSELELVRRDRQVPIRWFREVFADLDPDSATRFGLAFAEQAQLTSFGPLSLPLISAASVAEVFDLLGYLPIISASLRPHFHQSPTSLTVGLTGQTDDPALNCLVIAYGGAALLRLLDMLAGELPAVTLHLAWEAPRTLAPDAVAGRLVFGAHTSFIDVPVETLSAPCRFPDPVAYRLAITELRRTLERDREPTSISETIRRAIEENPARIGRDEVAATLGMSVSTVKRRLDAEGTTFRELREAVLRERAIVRLLDASLPISQIATDLGYSDLANFSHAFKRWTGQSPVAFRRAGSRIRTDAEASGHPPPPS